MFWGISNENTITGETEHLYTNLPAVTLVVGGEEVATREAVDHAIIKEPLARMSGTSSSLLNDVDLSDSPLQSG